MYIKPLIHHRSGSGAQCRKGAIRRPDPAAKREIPGARNKLSVMIGEKLMKIIRYPVLFTGCLMLLVVAFLSCSKPKEAKVIISSHEFSLRKLSKNAYTIDAKGKAKNVGEADVKKVVVTGYCRSCTTGLAPGRWSVSERERAPEEKCVINFIPAGGEADFTFTDVAVIYTIDGIEPKEMPEKLEAVIESFEKVN